ncbi:unnamed protein product [Ectocarpus sp. CCAP 1310/34]|nr:unnamed protein product [Ectocarpus sp. CCAP 1310/34]
MPDLRKWLLMASPARPLQLRRREQPVLHKSLSNGSCNERKFRGKRHLDSNPVWSSRDTIHVCDGFWTTNEPGTVAGGGKTQITLLPTS